MTRHGLAGVLFGAMLALAAPSGARALEDLVFDTPNANEELRDALIAASALRTAREEDRLEPQDIVAAALSDYRRLLEALYAAGYYGGSISIRIDGREVSEIPLISVPRRIGTVRVIVDKGPRYFFGETTLAPVTRQTERPEGFRRGERAYAPVIEEALDGAVTGWREAGHAKVATARESVTANHSARRLDVDVRLDPGPRLAFGRLRIASPSAVRDAAIRRIAGLPTGAVFSPGEVETVAERLRRTGAFAAVTLDEAETPNPDGTLDMIVSVTDQKPRRFGFGAEISSIDGLRLSAFWLHRNLLGGAERLRVDAAVENIGADASGMDYSLGARIEIPAVLGPDTRAFALAKFDHLDEPTFVEDRFEIGGGLVRKVTDAWEVEAGVTYVRAETDDDQGERSFSLLTFPLATTYDRRDNELAPTSGYFAKAELRPFVNVGGEDTNGARAYFDLRGYLGLGQQDRTVLAGRLQYGAVLGPDLTDAPPDFLFTSGGGGTVRGQPYQSLDVDLGGGDESGGRNFVGLSAEVRQGLTDSLGLVVFADAGYVGAETTYDGSGEWHSGAGLGLRYITGIGAIRLDVAGPTSGDTGDGVQFYIGIGQAF